MRSFLKLFFALSIVVAMVSCSDDDDFVGVDKYIISFDLSVGGVTYQGAVTGDQIMMSVPESVSLNGAEVHVELSENASISPDPSEILDWSTEEQFVVTSYNEQRKSYIYRINRTSVSTSGNVVLTTQDEVDAFAATGVSIIDGNLTIGKTTGSTAADSIQDLSGLSGLRQVVHNITINNTYAGEDLSGLSNLEKIGGLKIGTVASLKEISFPKLISIGTLITIGSTTLENLNMPELAYVGEGFSVKSDALKTANFGELRYVDGDMIFNGSNASAQSNTMETISFPKLENVYGTMTMSYWPTATKIDLPILQNVEGLLTLSYWNKIDVLTFPALESTGGLTINNSTALSDLDMPVFTTVNGNITLSALNSIETLFINSLIEVNGSINLTLGSATGVTFGNLTTVTGNLNLPSGASNLVAPYFPVLGYIGGDLSISAPKMTDLTGFPALEEIGAKLHLQNVSKLTSLEGLSSLKRVGASYYLYGLTALTDLDIRGVEIPEILIYLSTWTDLKITGDQEFDGKITLGTPPSGLKEMPDFIGIKTIRDLSISTSSYSGAIELDGIEEVTGLLDFTSSNKCELISMPDMKSVGAIKFSYNNSLVTFDAPALEEITGYVSGGSDMGFNYPVSSNIGNINLPKLKKIQGNFTLTGLTAARPLTGVNMPLIESISGTVTITGTNNGNFKSLDNFNNLTSVGEVTISNFINMTSFEGFRNALSSLSESTWKVTGCKYNPTYQNMLDAAYTQP